MGTRPRAGSGCPAARTALQDGVVYLAEHEGRRPPRLLVIPSCWPWPQLAPPIVGGAAARVFLAAMEGATSWRAQTCWP
jgi:hypothetical protein